jgi:hypothetical protein
MAMKTDGRYLGGDAELSIVLRVDVAGSAVISGELSRYGELLASMRTAPGVPVTGAAGQWPAVWQDRQGATSTGTLTVAAMPDRPDRLAVTIRLDAAIAGLRPSVEHAATVEWQGPELRDLALEIETEQGVQPAGPVDFQGAATGLAECLRAAGFTLGEAGDQTRITAQSQPWDYSMIFTILNDLMAATATANLSRPEWIVHLLQLSRCSRARRCL